MRTRMPMLSRVADCIYWMSRYLERAANTSRYLIATHHLTLDLPGEEFSQWEALVHVTGDHEIFIERYGKADQESVMRFLAFDADYSSSIISCLAMARENARTVREIISPEMWEQINTFYHFVRDASREPEAALDTLFRFCESIMLRGMLLSGIAADTMPHGEAWHFFRLGRFLERADKTTRILDVKYFLLLPTVRDVGTAFDDTQWAALLRAASGLEAYRQVYGRVLPTDIAEFLLLDGEFPRSARYCLNAAQKSLHAISETPLGTYSNKAEKALGKLCAELSYEDIDEIFKVGLHEYIDHLQTRMNEVHDAIQASFMHLPPAAMVECVQ